MSKIDTLMRDLTHEVGAVHPSYPSTKNGQPALTSMLRVIGPLDELSSDLPINRHSPPEDWSDLIERVRLTAARMREVEADAEEQEYRVRDLLERVREDIRAANERADRAEMHARDTQARTDALLKASDERIKAAEERARIAEGWLTLLKRTFVEEFEGAKAEKRSA